MTEFVRSLSIDEIPVKLRCASCNKLCIDAFRMPCCNQNVCDSCQISLPESCPVCMHNPVSASDCRPNKSLRLTVKAFLKNEERKRDKERGNAILTDSEGQTCLENAKKDSEDRNAGIADAATGTTKIGVSHHGIKTETSSMDASVESRPSVSKQGVAVEQPNLDEAPPREAVGKGTESISGVPQQREIELSNAKNVQTGSAFQNGNWFGNGSDQGMSTMQPPMTNWSGFPNGMGFHGMNMDHMWMSQEFFRGFNNQMMAFNPAMNYNGMYDNWMGPDALGSSGMNHSFGLNGSFSLGGFAQQSPGGSFPPMQPNFNVVRNRNSKRINSFNQGPVSSGQSYDHPNDHRLGRETHTAHNTHLGEKGIEKELVVDSSIQDQRGLDQANVTADESTENSQNRPLKQTAAENDLLRTLSVSRTARRKLDEPTALADPVLITASLFQDSLSHAVDANLDSRTVNSTLGIVKGGHLGRAQSSASMLVGPDTQSVNCSAEAPVSCDGSGLSHATRFLQKDDVPEKIAVIPGQGVAGAPTGPRAMRNGLRGQSAYDFRSTVEALHDHVNSGVQSSSETAMPSLTRSQLDLGVQVGSGEADGQWGSLDSRSRGEQSPVDQRQPHRDKKATHHTALETTKGSSRSQTRSRSWHRSQLSEDPATDPHVEEESDESLDRRPLQTSKANSRSRKRRRRSRDRRRTRKEARAEKDHRKGDHHGLPPPVNKVYPDDDQSRHKLRKEKEHATGLTSNELKIKDFSKKNSADGSYGAWVPARSKDPHMSEREQRNQERLMNEQARRTMLETKGSRKRGRDDEDNSDEKDHRNHGRRDSKKHRRHRSMREKSSRKFRYQYEGNGHAESRAKQIESEREAARWD